MNPWLPTAFGYEPVEALFDGEQWSGRGSKWLNRSQVDDTGVLMLPWPVAFDRLILLDVSIEQVPLPEHLYPDDVRERELTDLSIAMGWPAGHTHRRIPTMSPFRLRALPGATIHGRVLVELPDLVEA
jgi:hypothetical protein